MTPRRWFLAFAALAGALLTARLGLWQLDRAAQKTAAEALMQARRTLPALTAAELAHEAHDVPAQVQRMVRVQGRWSPPTVYLDNRQMNGIPGFYVVTPLVLDDGRAVLVQRGWLPRDPTDRTRIAAPPLAGPAELRGHIAPGLARLYDFGGAASGAIRQNLDLDAFARETGLKLLPLAIVQDGDGSPSDGLRREWPQPAADVQRNYGYAVQWFAMSALIIGLYVWFQLIRPLRARR